MSFIEDDLDSYFIDVEIVEPTNPHSFWACPVNKMDEYSQMIDKLQDEYANVHNADATFMPTVLVPGSLYCTYNQSFSPIYVWHRCELIEIKHTEATVFYIDIGTTALIPIQSLKILKVKIL